MKSKLLCFFLVFHCSLLIFHCPLSFAQCWPTTTNSAITVAPGWYPYAAVDEQEQSVMVVYLAGAQIRVKKYSKYGCPMWNGNPAIALDTIQKAWLGFYGNQWGQVISDDSGGVIICWKDFRHSNLNQGYPLNDEVYVQRIDVNGAARFGPNGMRISGPHTDGRRIIGDMKTDYHNGFYIAYSADSNTTKTVLKHYDRNGNLLWAKYFSYSGYIDLNATDIQGNCFVSTANRRFKFDYNGNALWPDTLIGRIPDDIEYNRGGAFSDDLGGVIGTTWRWYQSSYFIYVNRVDSNGQFLFGDGIDIANGIWLGYSKKNYNGLYISWDADTDVKMQGVFNDGLFQFTSIISICDTCGNDGEIIDDKGNGIISIWKSSITNDSLILFAQRIDSNGVRQWDNNGYKFHVSYNEPFEFPINTLFSNFLGGAYYLWTELDPGIMIKLKQISKNGILGEVDSTISIIDDNHNLIQFVLYQNFPNPFNSSTTINYQLKKGGKIQLKLYNILGQEVKTLVNEFKQEGTHQYHLDMNQFASGVYIYRLITSVGTKSKKLLFIK